MWRPWMAFECGLQPWQMRDLSPNETIDLIREYRDRLQRETNGI